MDADIVKAERETRALENTVRLLTSRNQTYHRSLARVHDTGQYTPRHAPRPAALARSSLTHTHTHTAGEHSETVDQSQPDLPPQPRPSTRHQSVHAAPRATPRRASSQLTPAQRTPCRRFVDWTIFYFVADVFSVFVGENPQILPHFYREMLCIRGTSHSPVSVSVSVCVCVCHKSEFC